jgi:hypothetical protein
MTAGLALDARLKSVWHLRILIYSRRAARRYEYFIVWAWASVSEAPGSSGERGEHAVDVGEAERCGFLWVLLGGVLDRESPW